MTMIDHVWNIWNGFIVEAHQVSMRPRPPQSRKEHNGASAVCSLFDPVMRINDWEEARAREANFVPDNLENLQSRTQWRKDSSCSPHREQTTEFAIFLWFSKDKVGTALWQASQMRNLYFSGTLSLQIQDHEIISSLSTTGFERERSQL